MERKELASGDQIKFGTVVAVFKYVAGAQLDEELEIDGTLVDRKGDVAKKMENLKKIKRRGLLTLLGEDGRNRTILWTSEATVGRAPDNDLVINERHVSSRHPKVVCRRQKFEVFDLRSTCGTFVDGVAVQEKLLASGDKICFGVMECLFQIMETNPDGSMNGDGLPPRLKRQDSTDVMALEKTADRIPEPERAQRSQDRLHVQKDRTNDGRLIAWG